MPHVEQFAPGTIPKKATKVWHNFLRTVYVETPKELRRAESYRRQIRRVGVKR